MTSYPPLLLVGAGALFVGVFVFVVALAAPTLRRRGATRAMAIEQYIGLAQRQDEPDGRVGGLAEEIVAFGERVMRDRDSTPRLVARLQQADLPLRPGEWWVLRVVAVVVGVAAGLVLLGERARLLGLLLGLLVGLLGPALVLRVLVRRRVKAFERLLPEVLMLVASSLSTGFSLLQALDGVARDAAEPAAKEFGRALAETRLGTDVEVSLQSMAKRMESRNMEWTAMAIQIQRTVGGNLAETLRTTAATLREREMLKRQVIALSAEGKMSAYILVGLPFGIFLFLLRANYDYVALLWTRPLGLLMLAVGAVSLGIGIAWMRSITNLKV
ncbi:type II secretion system F family protein [Lapillicoccus jejuensis]|uniref:Tight adherence protein B n=1 Tax=Lapillicoccus jejuensis TaxID=402171 RepID=A0A542E2I5_9MICO|nr:type II secretion system F family protein [Lapillicoccus jejuensis]TQJ09550.1 tight adherence protein B [Lapillicoccus jejuensis]